MTTNLQLFQRIQNLDRLYLAHEQLRNAADAETDPEAKRGLHRVADGYSRQYERLVKDRRRVNP